MFPSLLTTSLLATTLLTATSNACLLDSEIQAEHDYQAYGTPIHRRQYARRAETDNGIPIGTGDRFSGGDLLPTGLGIDDRDLESILNPKEVESALRGLAHQYSTVELFTPPFHTHGNATLHGAVIGQDPRVMIVSGMHARERGGPDNVVYLIADLLKAQTTGKGLTYGNKTYTALEVQTALSAGLVVLPLANPDGVAYDQATDSCWRKNRNPKSAKGDSGVGIDLNRNFDFLWDYTKSFSRLAETSSAASDNPDSEVFHGTAPASEPEVQAVMWTFDQFDSLSWYLDLHSFGGDILYAWGDDNVQHNRSYENFVNTTYDGTRGFLGDDPPEADYKEFMHEADFLAERDIAEKMVESMDDAGNVSYMPLEAVLLYPTSGASTDYAHGRYYSHMCGASKLRSMTLEFGQPTAGESECPFYPTKEEYLDSMRSVSTGLMELLLNAAGQAGEPVVWVC